MNSRSPVPAIYNSHQGEAKYNRTMTLNDVPDFQQRLDVLKAKHPRTIEPIKPSPFADTPATNISTLMLLEMWMRCGRLLI